MQAQFLSYVILYISFACRRVTDYVRRLNEQHSSSVPSKSLFFSSDSPGGFYVQRYLLFNTVNLGK